MCRQGRSSNISIGVRSIRRAVGPSSARPRRRNHTPVGRGREPDFGRPWSPVGRARDPWAVAEANWTYRAFGIGGYAGQGDIDRAPIRGRRGHGILAAFAINEISDETRSALLPRLIDAHQRGAHVLIIEPIAKRLVTWWPLWADAFMRAGGRADEWRFHVDLPERQRQLGRAAGLVPRGLTARSLWM